MPLIQRHYEAIDALSLCRGALGVSSTSLSVLRALASFLPKVPEDTPQGYLVWPSNQALAERANGMEERTLRRHLSKLVEIGLIQRNDSPNGKRYAVRIRKSVVMAFGFDLTPLAERCEELKSLANESQAKSEEYAAHKTAIRALLHQIEATVVNFPEETAQATRLLLRRKTSAANLLEAIENLRTWIGASLPHPSILTVSNSQNVRHQQKTEKESYMLKEEEAAEINDCNGIGTQEQITLSDCLEAASESIAFSPTPVRTWNDLCRLGTTLAPMIGIRPELFAHARTAMGHLSASLSVLFIIQKGTKIGRPAAYYRKLAQLAENGAFSLFSMVRGATEARFSAANSL